MSDPNRLLQEGASGFERQLLSAALTDRPTRDAHARLLVSLGVAGATTAATASAGGAGAGGALSAATKAWALKSLCAVALTAAAGAVTVRVVRSPVERGPEAASAGDTVRVAVVPPAVGTAIAPPEQAAPSPASSPPSPETPVPAKPAARSRPAPIARPVAAAAAPSASPEGASAGEALLHPAFILSLAEETAALDAARSALRGGRVTEALALLDDCARRFPGGPLQPEASAVRVEALLALGDRSDAETVARALVAAAPRTFAAHRVKAMLNW